jgi:hypothetical protein
LRGLFLKPAQAIIEPLMLRNPGTDLLEHVDQRVLVPQHDRGQDAHVLAKRILSGLQRLKPSEQTLHLSAEEFEGYGLGHGEKLVLTD